LSKATKAPEIESVRDRILNTARDLFYAQGVHAVGVDTVVAKSGAAKTSLYRWFPSKDALIVAVLEKEAEERWSGWDHTAVKCAAEAPREQLRAHLRAIVRYVTGPNYRGCPFMNVTAEFADPNHPGRAVALEIMHELRRRVRVLVDALEVRSPEELTEQLVMLIDGAFSSAQVFGKQGPHTFLVAAADALVDAQSK
jgi:AcrR family transcriptional regulator